MNRINPSTPVSIKIHNEYLNFLNRRSDWLKKTTEIFVISVTRVASRPYKRCSTQQSKNISWSTQLRPQGEATYRLIAELLLNPLWFNSHRLHIGQSLFCLRQPCFQLVYFKLEAFNALLRRKQLLSELVHFRLQGVPFFINLAQSLVYFRLLVVDEIFLQVVTHLSARRHIWFLSC